jgi:hypothetical protein
MEQTKRRMGRPPKDPEAKVIPVTISVHPWMDRQVREIAEGEGIAYSHVIQRFVRIGLEEAKGKAA